MTQLDVVYARVSTDEQAKDGKTSIGEQIEGCKTLLSNNGLTNFKIFQEDYSGFEYDRPELDKIKRLMMDGKVRSFAVLRVDRLCRKVSVLEKLRDGYFKPLDIQVYSTDLGRWLWNPQQEAMQEMYATMASHWGKMAVEVMQNGRKAHVENGNIICCGRPPLGFNEIVERDHNGKRLAGRLEFNQVESSIVLRIYENLVTDGMSVNSIAKILDSDNIPTYTQLRGDTTFREKQQAVSKSRHKWRGATVRQILVNSVYNGRWKFGRTKTVKTMKDGKIIKKRVRDDSNAITVEIEPLVPNDVWQEAHRILAENKKAKVGAPIKYDYLLRRRMTCKCGYKMNCHAKKKGKYLYYVCSAKKRGANCDIVSLTADLVDDLAWQWLYELLTDQNKLRSKIDNYITEQQKVLQPLQERLDIIDTVLQRKESEHGAMIDSYYRLPELAQAKVIASMERLEEEIKEHRNERENIKKEIDQHNLTVMMLTSYTDPITRGNYEIHGVNIPEFAELDRLMEDDQPLTFEEKTEYVKDFDLRATVLNENEILVQCKLDSEIIGLNRMYYRHRV